MTAIPIEILFRGGEIRIMLDGFYCAATHPLRGDDAKWIARVLESNDKISSFSIRTSMIVPDQIVVIQAASVEAKP